MAIHLVWRDLSQAPAVVTGGSVTLAEIPRRFSAAATSGPGAPACSWSARCASASITVDELSQS